MNAATQLPAAAPPALAGDRENGPRKTVGRGWPAAVVVALLTLVGVAIRVVVAHQSVYADELSTYWIITTHGLGGVISAVHSNDEITPPLYFVLSWLTTHAGHSPELLRAPSLVAGAVSIPLAYRLGLRTVGRQPALVATAITALAPFMIYYSAEARAYALMMALVMGSTLAMLLAAQTRRIRWWVIYAACSCAAAYTHYTCVFVLGAQLLWLFWAHPDARKPAVLANVAALVGFAPWFTGLINDLNSPTSRILSALSPFTPDRVRLALEHWSIGYPDATVPLRHLPGVAALLLLAASVLIAVAGVVLAWRRAGSRFRLDRTVALVVALALSVPVGEAAVSAVSTHVFGVRNLAASWPAFALLLAALLMACGRRLRFVVAALAIASFAIGAGKMLEHRYQRPNYRAAADFVDRHSGPGDVVIDETGVASPGPLTAFDVTHRLLRQPVFRAGAPAEHGHPFGFADPIVSLREAVPQAARAAAGRRILLVKDNFPSSSAGGQRTAALQGGRFPRSYRLVDSRRFPGIYPVEVRIYAEPPAGG